MWKELFQVLSDNNPVEPMTQELMQMLEITKEMSSLVHEHVFDQDFGSNVIGKILGWNIAMIFCRDLNKWDVLGGNKQTGWVLTAATRDATMSIGILGTVGGVFCL